MNVVTGLVSMVHPTAKTSMCFCPLSALTQSHAALTQPTARKEATPEGQYVPQARKEQQTYPRTDTLFTNSDPAHSPDTSLRKVFF